MRALAIGSLINDAVSIFLEHETEIVKGEFEVSLMDKSQYKAQIADIIKLSVKNIYQSKEVIEKEIIGYKVIHTLLDTFITAYLNSLNNQATNYDALVLNLIPENTKPHKQVFICNC